MAILLGLGIFASVSAASTDQALGCTAHHSITASSFDYAICGLPDLDQVRQQTATTPGLPGDGYNYCVPTSTMDALAYFASHGIPALRPGSKDWTDPANYNEMTADIHALGDLMGTTAAAGTSGGYFAGLTAWLAQTQPGAPVSPVPFISTSHLWVTGQDTGVFAPTLRQMADDASAGNIVLPNIVFMQDEKPPSPASGPKQWFDVGGHVVSLSSAKSPSTIGLHDPAQPITDHNYQAPYNEEQYTLTPVTSTFGYLDSNGNDVNFPATLLRIDNYPLDSLFGDGTQAYIWAYTMLLPETVTTWSLGGKLVAKVLPGEPVESFTPAGGDPIVDLVLDPSSVRNFYITQNSSSIWVLDPASGASTQFADAGGRPSLIAFAGRSQTLFALGSSGLTAFDANGKSVGSAQPNEKIDALAVEQATSRLLALSAESGRLRVFDSKLNLLGTVTLPRGVVTGSGKAELAVHNKLVYVHRDGRSAVAIVELPKGLSDSSKPAAVHFVPLRGASQPQGLAVDDGGHIFVTISGRLAEYGPSGKRLERSPFDGAQAGSSVAVTRSFSDVDPKTIPFADFLPASAKH